MTTNDTFEHLKEEFTKMKDNFQEKAQGILKEEFKKVFDNTSIKVIRWTQYTPYFNDGDVCIFDVNEPVFATESETQTPEEIDWNEIEYGADDDEDLDFKAYTMFTMKFEDCILSPDEIAMCKKLAELLDDEEMTEILKEMFGNPVEVIATANGFIVTEYEHE